MPGKLIETVNKYELHINPEQKIRVNTSLTFAIKIELKNFEKVEQFIYSGLGKEL